MMNMPKSSSLANPFATWSGHRLFQVIAGTLVGVMVASQSSAMLPTPEPELDNPSSNETARIAAGANNHLQNNQYNNLQAVQSKISAFLVAQDENGQEVLLPVDANTRLQSGNVLEYHGYFTNTNRDRIRDMTVTMTIPNEVELYGDVAPELPLASVDGQNFRVTPMKGTVNGQFQEIPEMYYKALRWNMQGVGFNDTVMVKYRAKVK